MHGEFMLVDGGKMSKKLGNTYTLDQLAEKGYSPMVFRYFCLNAHYRKKLNFTFEGMDAAKTSYERLLCAVWQHKTGTDDVPSELIEKYRREFEEAVADDLNLPLALGVLWTLVKEPKKSNKIYELILEMDRVFGLSLDKAQAPAEEAPADVPEEIRALCEERQAARKAKDFARADALRRTIEEKGFTLKDVPGGYQISRN